MPDNFFLPCMLSFNVSTLIHVVTEKQHFWKINTNLAQSVIGLDKSGYQVNIFFFYYFSMKTNVVGTH